MKKNHLVSMIIINTFNIQSCGLTDEQEANAIYKKENINFNTNTFEGVTCKNNDTCYSPDTSEVHIYTKQTHKTQGMAKSIETEKPNLKIQTSEEIQKILNSKHRKVLVSFTFESDDIQRDLISLRSTKTKLYNNKLNSIIKNITQNQDFFIKESERLGAVVKGRFWINNTVLLEFEKDKLDSIMKLEKTKLKSISYLPKDKTIPLNKNLGMHGIYDMYDSNYGSGTRWFRYKGFNGESGNRINPTQPLKMSLIEWDLTEEEDSFGNPIPGLVINKINCNHYAFRKSANDPTSRINPKWCGTINSSISTCVPNNTLYYPGWDLCGDALSHSSKVAGIMAGSIMDGQDPNITNSTDRWRRSGVATNSDITYYSLDNGSQGSCYLVAALQDAVISGQDVANMSFSLGSACNTNIYNSCSVGEALINTFRAGVVLVAGAGNDKVLNNECKTVFPGFSPATLSVGGLNTRGTVTGEMRPYNDLQHFEEPTPSLNGSSYGSMSGTYWGGAAATINTVDIAAPFTWVSLVGASGAVAADPYYQVGVGGTSYSSPYIAGIAGIIRQWMTEANFEARTESGAIAAQILLSGDGDINAANEHRVNSTALKTGAGRVKSEMYWLRDSSNNIYFNSYYYQSMSMMYGKIYPNQIIEWPIGDSGTEPTNVKGVKAALYIPDGEGQSIPDIDIQIVNRCSGQSQTTLAKASRQFATRKWLRISNQPDQLAYPFSNKCMWVQVISVSVPSQGSNYYAASLSYKDSHSKH